MFVIDTFETQYRSTMFTSLLRQAMATGFAVIALVAISASPAKAQRYSSIAPKMDAKAARTMRGRVSQTMRNPAMFQAGGKELLDRYFKTYYFPRMTQSNPGSLAELGNNREGLVKLLRGSTVPEAQVHLTNLTLGVMRVLSRGNYHPSVRYNAALIIGMLDKQYARTGANPAPPITLPTATNDLLELLEQDKFKDVKVHPGVKVAALEGLERHVRFGLDAQYGDRVTKAALAMLAQEPTVLDVDMDVNNWIKCQAARVLARQFKDGPSDEVHAALTKLIADEKVGLEDRCCIVGLLDKMQYSTAAGTEVAATLVPLGVLTKEVIAEGAEKAREFEEIILGNGPRRGSRGGYGSRGRGEQGPKLERRLLLARLSQIEKGAKSLSAGLPDEDKQKVQSLTELLAPVMTISGDKRSLDLDVAGDVIKLENTVNNMIASWQPAAAPAADADAAFAE